MSPRDAFVEAASVYIHSVWFSMNKCLVDCPNPDCLGGLEPPHDPDDGCPADAHSHDEWCELGKAIIAFWRMKESE